LRAIRKSNGVVIAAHVNYVPVCHLPKPSAVACRRHAARRRAQKTHALGTWCARGQCLVHFRLLTSRTGARCQLWQSCDRHRNTRQPRPSDVGDKRVQCITVHCCLRPSFVTVGAPPRRQFSLRVTSPKRTWHVQQLPSFSPSTKCGRARPSVVSMESESLNVKPEVNIIDANPACASCWWSPRQVNDALSNPIR